MRFKFFTIPALNPANAEKALNAFCAQHVVVSVEKQWMTTGDSAYWAVCVNWISNPGSINEQSKYPKDQKKPRVDYKEVLSEELFHQYSVLRDLRKMLAQQEGVPVYNIFTNEQLAAMVQQQIISKTALQKLDGVGNTRVEKYSEPFLSQVREFFPNETSIHQS